MQRSAADNPNPATTEKRLTEFDKNRAKARSAWNAFMATSLTPEEATLARQLPASMQAYVNEDLVAAAEALRRQDADAARKALASPVSKLSPAAQDDH